MLDLVVQVGLEREGNVIKMWRFDFFFFLLLVADWIMTHIPKRWDGDYRISCCQPS